MVRSGQRLLRLSAWLTLVGAPLSGPISVAIVAAVGPQPAWQDVPTFVDHFHPVQAVPYALGFVMLAGFGLFAGAVAGRADEASRGWANAALLCTGVGIVFASANYVAQIAWVPFNLEPGNAVLPALAMANPRAITWGLEMFAYAWIGAGLWMLAPFFEGGGIRRWIRWMLAFNGVTSIAAAAMMGVVADWVLTPGGIVGFVIWNGLIIALMIAVLVDARASE